MKITGTYGNHLKSAPKGSRLYKSRLLGQKYRNNLSGAVFLSFLLITVLLCSLSLAKDFNLNNVPIHLYFSPNHGCTDAIVKEISQARSEVLVQAYGFTSKPIAAAILKAHNRGIRVEIILDKSNRSAKYSAADFTAHMGIPTFIDGKYAIAHNKIIIIDRETVMTGSFNFTKAAEERNAENLLIIKSSDLAKAYVENWHEHKQHSETYKGRGIE